MVRTRALNRVVYTQTHTHTHTHTHTATSYTPSLGRVRVDDSGGRGGFPPFLAEKHPEGEVIFQVRVSHDRLQKRCQRGHLRPRPAVVSKRGDDGALERVDEAGLELVEILEEVRGGRAEAKGSGDTRVRRRLFTMRI